MPENNNRNIKSLKHTIECHESYIKELQTTLYRGAVTDDRIATIQNQVQEYKDAILELEGDSRDAKK